MALDTVRLESPPLSEEVAKQVEAKCRERREVDLETGERFFEFKHKPLLGSWDSSIRLVVRRERWIVPEGCLSDGRHLPPVLTSCEPYLVIEASVHKALMGHNVYGGTEDIQAGCRWLIAEVGRQLGVSLPDGMEWRVLRLDWGMVYDLGSFEAVQEYIRAMKGAEFPRRQLEFYGITGLRAAGASTVVKLYHKGPEFYRHDLRRVKLCSGAKTAAILLDQANRYLRVEVEVKSPKLRTDFGCVPSVKDVTADYVRQLYDREVNKLLREGESEMKRVRTAEAVEKRLRSVYGDRLGGLLFGTWMRLAAMGEEQVKAAMSRPTFYRHRKLLVDAGCSWHGTDVVLREMSLVPDDFVPLSSDPRRVVGEDERVVELLKPYRVA